jgi:PIN domain nuclease of toxin-antitoxin system
MRLLADTNIVYRLFHEPQSLNSNARKYLDDADAVFVSAATIWEIAIKVKLGKLRVNPTQLVERIEAAGLYELPIYTRHTMLVADLPLLHTDPFDRILLAQAMSEPMYLLTFDKHLSQYSNLVIKV